MISYDQKLKVLFVKLKALINYGPLTALLCVDNDFKLYRSGKLRADVE